MPYTKQNSLQETTIYSTFNIRDEKKILIVRDFPRRREQYVVFLVIVKVIRLYVNENMRQS